MMLSKPIALESTAMRRFNADMKKGAVTIGSLTKNADILKKLGADTRLTAQVLQQATQINTLATHEMLSKMVSQGQLQISTLKSMFTGRHFTEIVTLYNLIGGNMDDFTDSIAKGADYLRDFDKQMFNVNNQIKQFKNQNLKSVNETLSGLSESLAGLLMIVNESGASVGKSISALVKLSATVTAFLGTIKLLTVVGKVFESSGGVAGILGLVTANPVVAGITAVAFAVGMLLKRYRAMRIEAEDRIDLNIGIENALKQSDIAQDTLDAQIKTIQQFKNLDFGTQGLSNINVSLIDMYKNSSDVLLNFDKLTTAQNNFKKIDYQKIEDEYAKKSEEMQKYKAELIKARNVEMAEIQKKIRWSVGIVRPEGKDLNAIKELTKYAQNPSTFQMKNEVGKDIPGSISVANLTKYFNQKYGDENKITSRMIASALSNTSKDGDSRIKFLNAQITKIAEELKGIEEKKAPIKNLVTARDTFQESSKNFYKDEISSIFKKYNTFIDIQNDGKMTSLKNREGLEALIMRDPLITHDFSGQIDPQKLASAKERIFSNTEISNKEKEIAFEKEKQEMYEEVKSIFAKALSKRFTTLIGEGDTKGLEKLLINDAGMFARSFEYGNKNITEKDLKISGSFIKAKQQIIQEHETKETTIKTRQYKQSSLKYEEALAKIGKTKAQQEIITYDYKLKQLVVDKQLLQEQRDSYTDRINKEYGKGSNTSKSLLSGNKAFLDKKIKQEQLNKNKSAYVLLTDYAKIVYKIETVGQKISTSPIERQEKAMKNMLSSFKKYADILNITTNFKGGSLIAPLEAKSASIQAEIQRSKSGFGQTYSMNTEGIDWQDFATQEYNKLSKQKKVLSKKESLGLTIDKKTLASVEKRRAKLEAILDITKLLNQEDQANLEIQKKKLLIMSTTGSLLSQLSGATGTDSVGKIGSIFTQFQKSSETLANNPVDFAQFANMDIGEIFKSKGANSLLKKAGAGMALGSTVGGLLGGQSAKSGGSMGGAVGGMVGGPLGMAIGSVAGAAFGKVLSKKDRTEDAAKYSVEQAKLYQKNTEALQELSQNMSNLSSGVAGLVNSLTSSFSKIPTFSNLSDATIALKQLQNTMVENRDFSNVAYQVTHKKKGHRGFMGIGSSPDTYWTETVKMSVDSMLKKYGFNGNMKEMSTDQMRDFSDYLKDLDMGNSDNFSMLASSITDYAEALDKLDNNIDKIFYDATMEGFVGISSLQETALREQIENFYKNLGIQIDQGLSNDIDILVKKMSTAVTITQDVRANFIKSWKEMGTSAGETFQTSLQPYMGAILNNMSQIYYDVYFSDISDKMEEDFKSLAEKMVELKKQGENLNWEDITKQVSSSFEDLLSTMNMGTGLEDSYNNILEGLQDVALEKGYDIGDMLNLGILTATQKDLMGVFGKALQSDKVNGGMVEIGSYLGGLVGTALSKKITESLYSDTILNFSKDLDNVLSGEIQFSNVAGLLNQATSVGIGLEQERLKMEAVTSLFDFDKDINYTTQDSKVTYSSGVSQSVVNNYNLSATVNAGNVIEADSIEALVESLLDPMIEKLLIDKGIDITVTK